MEDGLGLGWEWERPRNYGCIIMMMRCFTGYFSILVFLHKGFFFVGTVGLTFLTLCTTYMLL